LYEKKSPIRFDTRGSKVRAFTNILYELHDYGKLVRQPSNDKGAVYVTE